MEICEEIKTKIKRSYDVAVCGGGIAGISAALAAAREGSSVVLFEKQFALGGLATLGLITYYLPLCDGYGKQVSFGIAEELLRLSILHGAEERYPENWLDNIGSRGVSDKRFETRYNPQLFSITIEKLLIDAGVDIVYGTYVVAVKTVDDKIKYVITENKSGRLGYEVNSVVDATGDCDIAKFAGVDTDTFKQGNVLAAWYYSLGNKGYELQTLGYADIPDEEKTSDNNVDTIIKERFLGIDGDEISKQVCLSHMAIYNDFLKKRKIDSEFVPTVIASIPQIRMTRKIIGEYELSNKEEHKYFEDSIGMISNWKKRGPVYEVPFRILYNSSIKNLVFAGRCVSVNETMWDIMRVIPCCAVTGQAAGTAAAMGDDFTKIDVKKLQEILKSNKVVLHEDDLK